MDSKRVAQLLDRVNALHRSLHPSGEGQDISAIERDLMLSYLRQLYDLYLEESPTTANAVANAAATKIAKINMPEVEAAAPAAPPPPVADRAEAPVATPPLPPPSSFPAAAVVPPAPPAIEQPVVLAASSVSRGSGSNPKLAKLFAQPATKELSERLAQQPLKDLTRALTINNRVQYANTLFGGNSELMNSVLLRLNQLNSMASARPDLEGLALEFGWTEEEKVSVAQDFIKLVNRRYV